MHDRFQRDGEVLDPARDFRDVYRGKPQQQSLQPHGSSTVPAERGHVDTPAGCRLRGRLCLNPA